ncbi:uncharacterized protein CLUP02_08813 [Colletotrichum lupini]|uniref:Uncharacterized protein n=1 Tax=Colletotrichum lupini TaxID=145971 RepID=A0A9Q8WGZ3_9PEZI|nr:uncharacterized protein CLUP02_08813 [Colletotrichum lupini]UQC83318.1 hypothetical protein CLUP02_08813 [Colletotrichum lupini]
MPKLKQSEVVDVLGERYVSPRSDKAKIDEQVRYRFATSSGVVVIGVDAKKEASIEGVTPVSWGGSSYDGWGAATTFRSWSTGNLITNSIPLFELDFSPTESNVEFGRLTDFTQDATDAENAGELAYPQRTAWVQGAEKISISSHDHDFQPLVSDKRALISDEPPRPGLVGVESAVGLARGVTVAHGDRRGRRPLASGASQTRRSFLDILSQKAIHCEVALAWWIKGGHGSVPRKSVPDGSADTEVFRGQDNRTHSSTERQVGISSMVSQVLVTGGGEFKLYYGFAEPLHSLKAMRHTVLFYCKQDSGMFNSHEKEFSSPKCAASDDKPPLFQRPLSPPVDLPKGFSVHQWMRASHAASLYSGQGRKSECPGQESLSQGFSFS